jgi:hypothetical protein
MEEPAYPVSELPPVLFKYGHVDDRAHTFYSCGKNMLPLELVNQLGNNELLYFYKRWIRAVYSNFECLFSRYVMELHPSVHILTAQ